MAEAMRAQVASMLKGIDRYNPDNLTTLEKYVEVQARENAYDLEANLAVLKLYQFNPNLYQSRIATLILLKAITNLPHTDFVLCKCLLDQNNLQNPGIVAVKNLADLLEGCQFRIFWSEIEKSRNLILEITGFEDSIRKFICHVIGITYQTIERHVLAELLGGIPDPQLRQWMTKYGWKEMPSGMVFISTQDEIIKTKNITEKIDFESVSGVMTAVK
ncbi:Eukaryotic translation initiation factor 3 subunit K [Chamberlinius hualienensis]